MIALNVNAFEHSNRVDSSVQICEVSSQAYVASPSRSRVSRVMRYQISSQPCMLGAHSPSVQLNQPVVVVVRPDRLGDSLGWKFSWPKASTAWHWCFPFLRLDADLPRYGPSEAFTTQPSAEMSVRRSSSSFAGDVAQPNDEIGTHDCWPAMAYMKPSKTFVVRLSSGPCW